MSNPNSPVPDVPLPFTHRTLAREAWGAYCEFRAAARDLPRPSQQAQDIYGKMEEATRQREANGDGWAPWYDPMEAMLDSYNVQGAWGPNNFGPFMTRPLPVVYQLPMKRGEDLPVYLTEEILRIIRENQRFVIANSEYAQAALENRINYTVGTGFSYEIEPMPKYAGKVDAGELENCQHLIDLFVEYNQMGIRECEGLLRLDIEGEGILRLFEGDEGMLKVRFVEPDLLRAPGGDYSPVDSFGIFTDRYDVEEVKGYGIVYDPIDDGYQPTFVPESEVVHFKRNNFLSAKRGRPLFYQCEAALLRASAIMKSASVLVRSRAKIALIRKLKGIAPTAAQNLVKQVTATGTDAAPVSGTVNIEQYRDGTIATISDREELEYPEVHLNPDVFVSQAYAELKGVAARCVIPAWWMTGDTGDMAAYTAALVAESPIVKMAERLDAQLTGAFGSNRVGTRRSLVMRFLWHCARRGWVNEEILPMCRVVCKGPSRVTRNKSEEATTNETYNRMGAKSIQTIQEEQGLDSDLEKKRIAEERAGGIGAQPQAQEHNLNIRGDAGQRFGELQGNAGRQAEATRQQEHGQPPRPGLMWDETSHHWVRPEDGKTGGFDELSKQIPEQEREKAESFFKRAYESIMGLTTHLAVKLGQIAPEILDDASDFSKIFFAAGKAVHDPFTQNLGIGPNTVAVIMSHALSRAATAIAGRLSGRKTEAQEAQTDRAQAIIAIFEAIGKDLGLPVPTAEEVQKWLETRKGPAK